MVLPSNGNYHPTTILPFFNTHSVKTIFYLLTPFITIAYKENLTNEQIVITNMDRQESRSLINVDKKVCMLCKFNSSSCATNLYNFVIHQLLIVRLERAYGISHFLSPKPNPYNMSCFLYISFSLFSALNVNFCLISTQCSECQNEKIQPSSSKQQKFWSIQALL